MKRLNIEKKLKAESDEFSPDPLDKIKLAAYAENLLSKECERNANVKISKAVKTKVKRKTVGFITAFGAVAACLFLILTLTFTSNGGGDITNNPSHVNLSAKDAYGFGAVSTVKLLGSNMQTIAVKSFSALNASINDKTEANNSSEKEVKEHTEKFNEYFTALDSFLGENIVTTSTVANPDTEYAYEIKMTITGKDFNGESVTYTMYYTETLIELKTDTDNEDDDEVEMEKEYKLEGVMVIDGTSYCLEGERSEENEKDESETELKIRAYANINDKTSYIEMEQEFSIEDGETETEYVYSIYKNGSLIEQTAVEFETENKNNKVENEYEIEFINGYAKGKYSLKREVKDSVTKMKVQYNIDGKSGVFHIREISDNNSEKRYEYSFSDGSVVIL